MKGDLCVRIVDTSIRSKRGSRISCCRIIWFECPRGGFERALKFGSRELGLGLIERMGDWERGREREGNTMGTGSCCVIAEMGWDTMGEKEGDRYDTHFHKKGLARHHHPLKISLYRRCCQNPATPAILHFSFFILHSTIRSKEGKVTDTAAGEGRSWHKQGLQR